MFDHEKVRGARVGKGLTPTQLASAAGVSERYIYRLEKGTSEPTFSIGVRIAQFLDLQIEELYLEEVEAVAS